LALMALGIFVGWAARGVWKGNVVWTPVSYYTAVQWQARFLFEENFCVPNSARPRRGYTTDVAESAIVGTNGDFSSPCCAAPLCGFPHGFPRSYRWRQSS